MNELAARNCVPCPDGTSPLRGAALKALLRQLHEWEAINEHHLTKTYAFPDFLTALEFVNQLGGLAEQQSHHPDLHLSWGRVRVEIWTHRIDGLTESDFVFAAKCDQLREDRARH